MRYFYDLEFNDRGYGDIDLISIGIVAEDGREYYAVNGGLDVNRIFDNPWLVENVWPHLPHTVVDSIETLDYEHRDVKSLMMIAHDVEHFICGDDIQLWAYYSAYDHVVMCRSLWGKMNNLPSNIPMWTHELMQLWESVGKPAKPEQEDEHHALADARWNRKLYEVCIGHSLSGP